MKLDKVVNNKSKSNYSNIMNQSILIAFTFLCLACNKPAKNQHELQSKIDSLETIIAESYKPGFGEFMSNIQAHHAKLWFAGQNENWKLADFEVHEIMESIEDIQKFQTERKESEMIGMINPALDSINNAILKQDHRLFKSSYTLLTNTCNNCHQAAKFEFNVVKIPEIQSFSNQDFKVQKK
ncbi:MAG: hypothetical protein ABI851_12935 [Saprospiraceae bacterium]